MPEDNILYYGHLEIFIFESKQCLVVKGDAMMVVYTYTQHIPEHGYQNNTEKKRE